MALNLNERQRAMLLEMGVRVWLPGTDFGLATTMPDAPVSAEPPPRVALPRPAVRAPDVPQTPVVARASVVPTATVSPITAAPSADGLGWEALAETVGACQACGLCSGRKNVSFRAATAAQLDWMVVGDPPDEDEDREGQPFAQAQGMLLDNMLKAVGARRDGSGAAGAYVTHVVKCRPPHGRIPQAAELAQCTQYLQREIALVQPKMILAMGRFAMQVLLGEQADLASQPLGKLRGTVYRYRGVPVVVTYAPQVLLRASADKAKAWADLCLAMDTLESV